MTSAALPALASFWKAVLAPLAGCAGSVTVLPVAFAHCWATVLSATRSGVLTGVCGKKSQMTRCTPLCAGAAEAAPAKAPNIIAPAAITPTTAFLENVKRGISKILRKFEKDVRKNYRTACSLLGPASFLVVFCGSRSISPSKAAARLGSTSTRPLVFSIGLLVRTQISLEPST